MKQILDAIQVGDLATVLTAMLDLTQEGLPRLKAGYRRESQLWDFKAGLPGLRVENEVAWAEVAAHVLAFHNAQGGVLLFGIRDADHEFVGTVRAPSG